MYPARKKEWFEQIFRLYNRNLLKRRFEAVYLKESAEFSARHKHLPTIVYVNHSSWWDGLVMFQLTRLWQSDTYAMMDEKPFLEHRFHEKLGGFAVRRENPRDAVKGINYAVEKLKERENRLLIIFPQGEIVANDARPLKLFQGLARIVEKCGECSAFPVALRYELRNNFKPEIFVRVGTGKVFDEKKPHDTKSLTEFFANELTNTLDDVKKAVVNEKTDDFQQIFWQSRANEAILPTKHTN